MPLIHIRFGPRVEVFRLLQNGLDPPLYCSLHRERDVSQLLKDRDRMTPESLHCVWRLVLTCFIYRG